MNANDMENSCSLCRLAGRPPSNPEGCQKVAGSRNAVKTSGQDTKKHPRIPEGCQRFFGARAVGFADVQSPDSAGPKMHRTPEGCHVLEVARWCGTPPGCMVFLVEPPEVFAVLNLRLLSVNPSGSISNPEGPEGCQVGETPAATT